LRKTFQEEEFARATILWYLFFK